MTYEEARQKMVEATRDRAGASKEAEAGFAEAMAFVVTDIAASLNNIAHALQSLENRHGGI